MNIYLQQIQLHTAKNVCIIGGIGFDCWLRSLYRFNSFLKNVLIPNKKWTNCVCTFLTWLDFWALNQAWGWCGRGQALFHFLCPRTSTNVSEVARSRQGETDTLLVLTAKHTLKMPPFCQAIFSIVSPRIWVWSIPREEIPHTHGLLPIQPNRDKQKYIRLYLKTDKLIIIQLYTSSSSSLFT